MRSRRYLLEYPTGARRRVYLGVVVLAVFISAFEGQLAPVLPLLLKDLGMSPAFYGSITAVSLLAGAMAGYLGGEMVDRIGRVRVLIPFAFISAASCLYMAMAPDVLHFTAARISMNFVEGIAMAGTAPLIRDFTPRTGRAQAYAFWTWGPVGANFFAAAIAALTLQLFDYSWRAQIYLMAGVALLGAIIIALILRDLHPDVRRQIRDTEGAARESLSGGAGSRSSLLTSRAFWTHVLAISCLYFFLATMNAYAQLMLVEFFGFSVRMASVVAMGFWVANLGASLFFARLSDRLRVRRGMVIGGGLTAAALLATLVTLMFTWPSTPGILVMGLFVLIGGSLGAVFSPWMASFSEAIEEIHPEGHGFAFGFNDVVKNLFILTSVLFAPHVADSLGWNAWMAAVLVIFCAFVAFAVLIPRHAVPALREIDAEAGSNRAEVLRAAQTK